ncbi:hypothetical protein [Pedobacter chitinilyticus]|uniref:Uncharacterized protein n=1 Tax=Pedobacter chitinilyticus TaxID=2233776 RepID=A0A3S3PZE7_9SPHI|nr:hypothetical protein [Pedobacter chitinilyticus]RWU08141.1 hypothetical protein DPV69_07105 [Pedobacter chitinilyticus]
MSNLFKDITWGQYLMAAAVLITLYYVAVLLIYYRKEMLLRIRDRRATKTETDAWEEKTDDSPLGELMVDLEGTIEDIAHMLEPGKQATKQELLNQLRSRVASFGGLGRPGYRYALNNYIIEKARENCGIAFSEQELEQEWENLSR